MAYLGLRVLTGMLWAAGASLLVAGTVAEVIDRRLTLYAWSMFLLCCALGFTAWVITEHVTGRESDRNARITADAVGEAVGQAISEKPIPTITRRGT